MNSCFHLLEHLIVRNLHAVSAAITFLVVLTVEPVRVGKTFAAVTAEIQVEFVLSHFFTGLVRYFFTRASLLRRAS